MIFPHLPDQKKIIGILKNSSRQAISTAYYMNVIRSSEKTFLYEIVPPICKPPLLKRDLGGYKILF